jgi:hypothetical protein
VLPFPVERRDFVCRDDFLDCGIYARSLAYRFALPQFLEKGRVERIVPQKVWSGAAFLFPNAAPGCPLRHCRWSCRIAFIHCGNAALARA